MRRGTPYPSVTNAIDIRANSIRMKTYTVSYVLDKMRLELGFALPDVSECVLVEFLCNSTILQSREEVCLQGNEKRIDGFLVLLN